MSHYLRTSDISRDVGVHPNTVRLYEEWGFMPPIPRSPSGYRLFNERHLEQMRLARLAITEPYGGRRIRRSAQKLVRAAAAGDLAIARDLALKHQVIIQSELGQARAASDYLEHWAAGQDVRDGCGPNYYRGQAAKLLDVTAETLRHWERNGLVNIPRDSVNNYRLYGPAEIDRLRVLRFLSRAGYSTMAILRMVRQLDHGRRDNLGQILDTPDEQEDLLYASDRWLSTLIFNEQRAVDILNQLEIMIAHL